MGQFLTSLYFALLPTTEIVIVGDLQTKDTREMLSILGKTFLPNTVTLVKDPSVDQKILNKLAPYAANYTSTAGKTTAYVCHNYSCESPTCDPEKLMNFLHN